MLQFFPTEIIQTVLADDELKPEALASLCLCSRQMVGLVQPLLWSKFQHTLCVLLRFLPANGWHINVDAEHVDEDGLPSAPVRCDNCHRTSDETWEKPQNIPLDQVERFNKLASYMKEIDFSQECQITHSLDRITTFPIFFPKLRVLTALNLYTLHGGTPFGSLWGLLQQPLRQATKLEVLNDYLSQRLENPPEPLDWSSVFLLPQRLTHLRIKKPTRPDFIAICQIRSIEHLTLDDVKDSAQDIHNLACIPTLRHLHISVISVKGLPPPSIIFPVLHTLELSIAGNQKEAYGRLITMIAPSLRHFSLDFGGRRVSPYTESMITYLHTMAPDSLISLKITKHYQRTGGPLLFHPGDELVRQDLVGLLMFPNLKSIVIDMLCDRRWANYFRQRLAADATIELL